MTSAVAGLRYFRALQKDRDARRGEAAPLRLIGIYETPSNRLPDGRWFQTWAEVKAAFLPPYQNLTTWPDDAMVTYTDHPYHLIARAALATMTDQPGGAQAWAKINQMIGPELLSNLNDDPKWAIVPRK
jgi:hypothetical protein